MNTLIIINVHQASLHVRQSVALIWVAKTHMQYIPLTYQHFVWVYCPAGLQHSTASQPQAGVHLVKSFLKQEHRTVWHFECDLVGKQLANSSSSSSSSTCTSQESGISGSLSRQVQSNYALSSTWRVHGRLNFHVFAICSKSGLCLTIGTQSMQIHGISGWR